MYLDASDNYRMNHPVIDSRFLRLPCCFSDRNALEVSERYKFIIGGLIHQNANVAVPTMCYMRSRFFFTPTDCVASIPGAADAEYRDRIGAMTLVPRCVIAVTSAMYQDRGSGSWELGITSCQICHHRLQEGFQHVC
jgi:hypothetical protein